MDLLAVGVLVAVFAVLVIAVVMMALWYRSMSKELHAVNTMLRKVMKNQSKANATVLDAIDKSDSELDLSNTTGRQDSKKIIRLLNEIISRLDSSTVPAAAPEAQSSPYEQNQVPYEAMLANTRGPLPPGLITTNAEPDDTEALPMSMEQTVSIPFTSPLPVEPGEDVPDAFILGTPDEEHTEKGIPETQKKTVIRCPECSRQLPYDAIKIQDEQICPYCNASFRSSEYLITLISEGQKERMWRASRKMK